ncbi:NAD(P)H-hydrate epimerase [Binucleata daphniae]
MKYLTKQDILEIEEKLVEHNFIENNLIESAGFLASEVIINVVQKKKASYLILIGPGNNGGDGLIIAKWLHIAGHNVSLYILDTKHEDLLSNCICLGIKAYHEKPNKEYDYVIDALFGINQRLPIKQEYANIISMYKDNTNIIAIDVPTGCTIDSNQKGIYDPIFVVTFTDQNYVVPTIRHMLHVLLYPKIYFMTSVIQIIIRMQKLNLNE